MPEMRFEPVGRLFMKADFPYWWRVRTRLPDRYGHPVKVLARGKMNTALVEFEDGFRAYTSRNYVRKLPLDCSNQNPQEQPANH